MTTLLHSTIGGEVLQTGPKRVEFLYKPGFVTFILKVFFGLCLLMGVIFSLLSLTGKMPKPPPPFPVQIFFFIVAGGLFFAIRFRNKSMGDFILDGEQKKLIQKTKDGKTREWAINETKFDLKWDPFHRSFQFQYWLVATTKENSLRLAKGSKEDMEKIKMTILSF